VTSQVIQHLRRAVLLQDGEELTDGQLLACFVERRDEAAFAALVRRHAPMVWGACRRLLSHHDAEDAFQATFLVLCRKAGSILRRELVANWLYGVAHQAALQARRTAARRRAREQQVAEMPDPAAVERAPWDDLQPLLDRELSRLPDSYRAAVVLCDLEGRTRKEAARQLGLPEGTVGSRLARARALLAKRLSRHGLAVAGGALAGMLSQSQAPASVVCSTLEAASLFAAGKAACAGAISAPVAALAEGVMKAMFSTRLKTVTAIVFLLVLLGAGPAAWTCYGQSSAGGPGPAPTTTSSESATRRPGPARPASDHQAIQGTWKVVRCELAGRNVPTGDFFVVITADRLVVKDEGLTREFAYSLDPRKTPRHIDWVPAFGLNKGKVIRGTYRLGGDILVLCTSGLPEERRPTEFRTEPGRPGSLMVLERETPAPQRPEWGKWEVDLREVHNNQAFKNTCVLCHKTLIKEAPNLDRHIHAHFGDVAIIRLPRKGGPEFIRRLYLDVLGRPPTPREIHYYLAERGPGRDRKLVEMLLSQEGSRYVVVKSKPPEKVKKGAGTTKRADLDRLWMGLFSAPPAGPGEGGAKAHRETALAQRELGEAQQQQGKLAEAEAAYRKALALQEKLVRDHPAARAYREELAGTLRRLGGLYRRTGRLAEAERALRRAIALLE
jgi:RNA polymerase sigma factor (sigma-70 family)